MDRLARNKQHVAAGYLASLTIALCRHRPFDHIHLVFKRMVMSRGVPPGRHDEVSHGEVRRVRLPADHHLH